MINKLFFVVKKFIFAVVLIYGFNVIVFPLNMTIAMNLFSILMVTVFGFPAVVGICLFSLFML